MQLRTAVRIADRPHPLVIKLAITTFSATDEARLRSAYRFWLMRDCAFSFCGGRFGITVFFRGPLNSGRKQQFVNSGEALGLVANVNLGAPLFSQHLHTQAMAIAPKVQIYCAFAHSKIRQF